MKQKSIQLLLLFLFLFSKPLYSKTSDCDIVKYITRYELKNDQLYQVDTIVFQINNRNGEEYSKFKIPYSKIEKITDTNGWIIDSNGKKVRTLKNTDIEDRSEVPDEAFYEDSYVKTFQLKHNLYPYRIYVTFKKTISQFITIANWSPIIYSKVPTIEAKLYITTPKECSIKKFVRGAQLIKSDTSKSTVNLEFSSKYDNIFCNQIFSEPFENIMPEVVIVPTHFFYGIKGNTDNWVTYGNWFLELNKDLLDLPESEKKVIQELVKNVSDQKEKVRILYHYMQDHTRYINVSLNIGGFRSYPASYVSENKYGDCKALTTYMKALLDNVGITSYYTLIKSSFQPKKLIEDIPFSQFNHILLCVPLKKDTLWLENTSNTNPFGYISSSIQNRKALFIDQNKSHFINMPLMANNIVSQFRKTSITLNISGNDDAQANFTFRGYNFEQYNQLNKYYNKDEQDRIVRELMPFINCEVKTWNLQKYQRDSALIGISTYLTINKIIKPLGNDFYFNLNPILEYSFESLIERKNALQIPFPINFVDTTIYNIPEDVTVKHLPENVSITNQLGKYVLKISYEGKSIVVYKELVIFPSFYPHEQYKFFYDFIKLIKEVEKKVVVLKRKDSNV